MRTHNTPRLCAGPQTAGTPIKFWNVASIGDDEGEITLYGDVVSRQPVDWWTGEPEPGLYIAPESFMEDLAAVKGKSNITIKINSCGELHPKSWTRKSTKGVQKSMGKELFSEELKLAVVQYVLEGHTRKEASEKFCVSCTPIEKWVNLYKLHGAKGLLSRNLVGRQKGFDGEFRLKVLQYKQEHHLSCTQTAMHFCLDVVTVCRWEKKFQKEGAQGLMKKQATKGSEKRQKKQEQSELQQENKRLSEENYRLKMENDYLKN